MVLSLLSDSLAKRPFACQNTIVMTATLVLIANEIMISECAYIRDLSQWPGLTGDWLGLNL